MDLFDRAQLAYVVRLSLFGAIPHESLQAIWPLDTIARFPRSIFLEPKDLGKRSHLGNRFSLKLQNSD